MKAIGYIRVSTEEQAASGLGLEAQRESIRKEAEKLGKKLATIYEDAGVSGASEVGERPGFLGAVGDLERGDVLLVARRDRVGRDPMIVGLATRLIERKGARLVSCAGEGTNGNEPTDILVRGIVDLIAQFERLVIGARTKGALKALKARGVKLGRPGFGEASMGKYRRAEIEQEQAVIDEILGLHGEGHSFRKIARMLEDRGHQTKLGGKWTHVQVGKVIRDRIAKESVGA